MSAARANELLEQLRLFVKARPADSFARRFVELDELCRDGLVPDDWHDLLRPRLLTPNTKTAKARR